MNNTFAPGQTARMICETEVSGYEDDDLEQEYTCIIPEGGLVEIIGEPISAGNPGTGENHQMIAVRVTEADGTKRDTVVELEDLTISSLS